MEHIKELRRNFEVALNHFNYADKEHIDVAIENLNIALNELNAELKNKGLPLQVI